MNQCFIGDSIIRNNCQQKVQDVIYEDVIVLLNSAYFLYKNLHFLIVNQNKYINKSKMIILNLYY